MTETLPTLSTVKTTALVLSSAGTALEEAQFLQLYPLAFLNVEMDMSYREKFVTMEEFHALQTVPELSLAGPPALTKL